MEYIAVTGRSRALIIIACATWKSETKNKITSVKYSVFFHQHLLDERYDIEK